jgi:hypothetical protein
VSEIHRVGLPPPPPTQKAAFVTVANDVRAFTSPGGVVAVVTIEPMIDLEERLGEWTGFEIDELEQGLRLFFCGRRRDEPVTVLVPLNELRSRRLMQALLSSGYLAVEDETGAHATFWSDPRFTFTVAGRLVEGLRQQRVWLLGCPRG